MKKILLGLILLFVASISTGFVNLPPITTDNDVGIVQLPSPTHFVAITSNCVATDYLPQYTNPPNKAVSTKYNFITTSAKAHFASPGLYDIQTFFAKNSNSNNTVYINKHSNTYRRARDAL